MRFSVISSAFVAAIVGFGSTIALIIAAAAALGATEIQTASWVSAICLAMVIETAYLSWRYKTPIVTAWSTPGLALIGASVGFSIQQGVGAFIITGVLLVITGLFKPLTRAVELIPQSVSAGMLGGVLLPFVIKAAQASSLDPMLVLPLIALFLILRLKNPPLAIIMVLICGAVIGVMSSHIERAPGLIASNLEVIMPEFSLSAIIGLAIPLYLVTMASQNLPGIAVLQASGYKPPAGPLISVTGLFSIISAFFGASTTNLAAITAAICTGEDAHPDKDKRWLTGPVYALCYMLFAVFGASLVALFAVLPVSLIALVAGLALLAPLTSATTLALKNNDEQIAAMATFAVTASGIAFFGIGAAFWGLIIGLIIAFLPKLLKR